MTTVSARERCDGHRNLRRTRYRDPHGPERLSTRHREECLTYDAARLALVCGHAVRRITLHVLEVHKALTMRKGDVRVRHVVLEVHEHLPARRARTPCRLHSNVFWARGRNRKPQ